MGECISIGKDIVVTVAEISGKPIRPEIDAPREVRVLREGKPRGGSRVRKL